MIARSRDDFTYLEIYRPVIEVADQFLEKARGLCLDIFGTEVVAASTNPAFEQGHDGQLTPVTLVEGLVKPKVEPYDHLRIHLLDRRVEPRLSYASRFRWVASRLIRNPDDPGYRPIMRDEQDQKTRLERRRRESLASIFGQIGLKYGITDLSEVELRCNAVDPTVDPPLEHLGLELSLVPDPLQRTTRMLLEHAGVCLRGLGRHSPKAANPFSPTALRVPFVRLPSDATLHQQERFIAGIQDELPVRLLLGNFEDGIHAPAWTKDKR